MRLIKEKLIGIGGKIFPKFNQIIFLAGGAGSGKGFLSTNLLGIDAKVIDTDAISGLLSKALVPTGKNKDSTSKFYDKLRDLLRNPNNKQHTPLKEDIYKHAGFKDGVYTGKKENDPWVKYKADIEARISNLEDNNTILDPFNPIASKEFFNPKDPRDVSLRYRFKKSLSSSIEEIPKENLELDDKQIISMVVNAEEGRRPNIIIDTTLSNPSKISETIDRLNKVLVSRGKSEINPEDVSLVWVLAPVTKAIQQNFSRDRSVGLSTLYDTHVNSTMTMKKIFGDPEVFTGGVSKYIDGDIIIIFNNGEDIKFNYEIVNGSPTDHSNSVNYKTWDKIQQGKSVSDKEREKNKSKVGYIDQYCACIVKHRGQEMTPLKDIPNLPIIGGRKGSQPMTVGNLLDLYTMPVILIANDREIDKMMQARKNGKDVTDYSIPRPKNFTENHHGLRLRRIK